MGWFNFASVAGSQAPFSRYGSVCYQWVVVLTGGNWNLSDLAAIYQDAG